MLYLYLSVTEHAVSVVIVQEIGKEQRPIYFISRVLQGLELRDGGKTDPTIGNSITNAKTIFSSYQVIVKTNYPIKQILRKPELAGRMIAWSVELSEFGFDFETRGPIKSQ